MCCRQRATRDLPAPSCEPPPDGHLPPRAPGEPDMVETLARLTREWHHLAGRGVSQENAGPTSASKASGAVPRSLGRPLRLGAAPQARLTRRSPPEPRTPPRGAVYAHAPRVPPPLDSHEQRDDRGHEEAGNPRPVQGMPHRAGRTPETRHRPVVAHPAPPQQQGRQSYRAEQAGVINRVCPQLVYPHVAHSSESTSLTEPPRAARRRGTPRGWG